MIFVDSMRMPADVTDPGSGRTYSSRWSHLISDSLDPTELHAFAAKLGMRRAWFQPGNTPGKKDGLDRAGDHYDLTDRKRREAIRLGAVEIDCYQLVDILRAKRARLHEGDTTMTATTQDHLLDDDIDTTGGKPDVPQGRYGRYILPDAGGKYKEQTSPSTLGASLVSGYGLGVWRTGQVAWGLAQRPDLVLRLAAVAKDDKETIKDVVAQAEVVAGTAEGANLGDAIHSILQRVDAGEDPAGMHPYFQPIIANYLAELARCGLRPIPSLIERVVMCMKYGVAGRLDNIYEIIATGELVIGDKKSEIDPTEHEQPICTQLGMYANAELMMNYETRQYEPMPAVRKDIAAVIHIDRETFEVRAHRFDIERGWASVRLAMEMREWNKAKFLSHPWVGKGHWHVPDAMAAAVEGGPEGGIAAAAPVAGRRTCPGCGVPDVVDGRPRTDSDHPDYCTRKAPYANDNGKPTPQTVADIANAVLDEAHGRVGSTTPHGVVAPSPQYAQAAEATYAPVETPGDSGINAETRIAEILDIRKNDKPRLQGWARDLGNTTDLNHHRKWLAEWIVAHDPNGTAVEPPVAGQQPASGRHPQSMAEAGFTGPAPAQPPGVAVLLPTIPRADDVDDLTEPEVLAEIAAALDMETLTAIWRRWTKAYGDGSWSGNVLAAANAQAAALQSGHGGQPG
jgi:hypothetical protein